MKYTLHEIEMMIRHFEKQVKEKLKELEKWKGLKMEHAKAEE